MDVLLVPKVITLMVIPASYVMWFHGKERNMGKSTCLSRVRRNPVAQQRSHFEIARLRARMSDEQAVVRIVTDAARNRFIIAVFAVVLVSAALYFGRVVLEPVAFVLFTVALVEPFQKAAEVRFGKPIALILTI
ncbi:MAG: hypothetical protein ACRD36_08085, partial [Candidatus Acidiferrum sp.]